MNLVTPLKFEPILKSVIWGGNKICEFKKIPDQEPNIGESWEISAVPGSESVVSEGEWKGKKISELIDIFGESFLGNRVVEKFGKSFPLLIKFIDANDNLSIQVHPDDKLAEQRHNCRGKTEMWYIIDANDNASIYSGFKSSLNPDDYTTSVKDGTFTDYIARFDSKPEQVYFLPAGRVHAIGAGNFLAEIQESSDITYRIYDYNRVDSKGNKRELHTEIAKDAIDYSVTDSGPVKYNKEADDAVLVSSPHFITRRLLIKGEKTIEKSNDSFLILMGIKGNVDIVYPSGTMELCEGSTVFIPASLTGRLTLKGRAVLLAITL